MTTSNGFSYRLAWRIFRYLAIRLAVGLVRLSWLLVVRSVQFTFGLLALIASPASSGRSPDEFKDLASPGAPSQDALASANGDAFWRMYLQAYSPRLWRMRRLLPMSAGKGLKDRKPGHRQD